MTRPRRQRLRRKLLTEPGSRSAASAEAGLLEAGFLQDGSDTLPVVAELVTP